MRNGGPVLWGVHAGTTGDADLLFLRDGYIALGWKEMGELGELPDDVQAFKEKLQEIYPDDKPGAIAVNAGQLHRFVHVMEAGDYVAFRPKTPVRGIAALGYVFLGRVAGPYVYNPFLNSDYPDVRRVDWLRSVPANRFSESALKELGAYMTLFQIDTHADEFLAAIAESR